MDKMNIMKYAKRDICPEKFSEYGNYKPYLRVLFNNECSYCTTSESENHLGFFHVDHFRPKSIFPLLETEYNNLYYVCHKCNVYKSNSWISIEEGCIRNCNKCNNKKCRDDNSLHFVDPCIDSPMDFFEENEEAIIIEKNNLLPAKYSIEKLRLNRKQLIRLRVARRKLSMWLDGQSKRLEKCEKRLDTAKEQLKKIKDLLDNQNSTCTLSQRERICMNGMYILLQQKVASYEESKEEIQHNLKNVADVVHNITKPYEW